MRSFYQSEMEAMLPQQWSPREGGDPMQTGVGHISRELQLQPGQAQQQQQQETAREMPRLNPTLLMR